MASTWTQQEIGAARKMRARGMRSDDIGEALGRTGAAVRRMFCSIGESKHVGKGYDGPPIEHCPEATRLRRNAILGSAKLRNAIMAMAA